MNLLFRYPYTSGTVPLLILSLTSVSVPAQGPVSAPSRHASTLLFSFEDPAEAHSGTVRPNRVDFSQTTEGATDGRHALQVNFSAGGDPGITFLPGASGSWKRAGADSLEMDITNPEDDKIEVHLLLTSPGKKATLNYELPGHATTAITAPIVGFDCQRDIGMKICPGYGLQALVKTSGAIDPDQLTSFQFFLPYPDRPHTLIFDNIRLDRLDLYDLKSYRNIVDEFGQYSKTDWRGKVHSLDELHTLGKQELEQARNAAWPTDWDRFGGVPSAGKERATGYFHVATINGRWWLIDPLGNVFFSTGVDALRWTNSATSTSLKNRWLFRSLPDPAGEAAPFYVRDGASETFDFYHYNVIRKYSGESHDIWSNLALARLRLWRFNTIETPTPEFIGRSFPYELRPSILGNYRRIATEANRFLADPFDPAFSVAAIESLTAAAKGHSDDPWLVGYFVDNELAWGLGTRSEPALQYVLVYKVLSEAGSPSPARRAFVDVLRKRYSTAGKFTDAWGIPPASWDELESRAIHLPTQPSQAARDDLSRLLTVFAEKYFTVVRDALRSADPHHLYLGVRFAGTRRAPFEVVQACAKLCDVVSFNIYMSSVDSDTWKNMGALGRPSMISEFHFGSNDRGVFGGGEGPVTSEQERARHFDAYATSVASNPDFVGYNWFLYQDQPLTGADYPGNPENHHVGLVSVTDSPWGTLTDVATRVNATVVSLHASTKDSKVEP